MCATPSRSRSGTTRPRCCANARIERRLNRAVTRARPADAVTTASAARRRIAGAPGDLTNTSKRPIPLIGRSIRHPRSSPLAAGSSARRPLRRAHLFARRITCRSNDVIVCTCADGCVSMPPGEAHGTPESSGRACGSGQVFGSRSRCWFWRWPVRRRRRPATTAAAATTQLSDPQRRSGGLRRRAASATRAAAPGAFPIRARPMRFAACWLKNRVPPRVEDKCCVSGVRGAGVIEPRKGRSNIPSTASAATIAISTLRPIRPARPARRPARRENKCRAWTYVRPGYIGADRALLSQGQASRGRGKSRAAFRVWCANRA